MNDLIKCSRCSKTLIAESFEGHDCSPVFRDAKTIMVDWFTVTKDDRGRKTVLANCMDGTLLTLVENDTEAIPIAFNPSDGSYHPRKSDGSDGKLPEPF